MDRRTALHTNATPTPNAPASPLPFPYLIRLHPPVDARRQPLHLPLIQLRVLPQTVVPVEVGQGGGDGPERGGPRGAEGLFWVGGGYGLFGEGGGLVGG